MRYWWVNQKQTHRHEIAGGYLWSPKHRADGGRNPFYESPLVAHDARGLLLSSRGETERSQWEEQDVLELGATTLNTTEREALVRARRGQGLFRLNVARIERQGRITHVSNPTCLIASHIKPWRHATNAERLSGDNCLFLAPQADFLFDRGYISFSDGHLLVSPGADEGSLVKLGVDPDHPPDRARPDSRREGRLMDGCVQQVRTCG